MKSLPFSNTLAHPDDPLPAHLERVGQCAVNNMQPCNREIRMTALLSGILHDIGKSTFYFQDYMLRTQRKSELTRHAPVGAILSWWITDQLDLLKEDRDRIRLGTFLAVLRHHGRLRAPWHEELSLLRNECASGSAILQQLNSIDLGGISDWFKETGPRFDIPIKFQPVKWTPDGILSNFTKGSTLRLRNAYHDLEQTIGFLAAFGGILSVDKIDAALEGEQIKRRSLPIDCVTRYKKARFISSDPLTAMRQQIADIVNRTLLDHSEEHLFTLTAPTGSGKTLTVLESALALRQKLEGTGAVPRTIYCLPFTTVIDQNYKVFSEVLNFAGVLDTQDVLLKHHHLTECFYRTSDNSEYEPDGAGELLTESWQSEIIVTTFYQLLHSILSSMNRELKRAGQLVNSIVLMDEVQAVPLKYWRAIRHLLQAMAKGLNTRFILLTATRPLIFQPGDAMELLPNYDEYFKALSRTTLVCNHKEPLSLDDFLERLASNIRPEQKATLIVVNRRKTVRLLYYSLKNQFPKRPCFALSTDLTPKDRRERIASIQESLRSGEPCIVVSTQLVEAGVDISFPVVHRDLAPLDCIIQTTGRCNRHNEGSEGVVYLWHLIEGKESQWRKVYDQALVEATCDVLGSARQFKESDYAALTQNYFEVCWQRADQDPIDTILSEGRFEELSSFKLIEEGPPTRSFFVVQNDEDQQLWDRYADLKEMKSVRDREREFKIFKRSFFERVVQVYGKADPDEPIQSLRAGKETYDPKTGFIAVPEAPSFQII